MKNYQKVDMHISSICKTAYIVLLFKIVVVNYPFSTLVFKHFKDLFFPSVQSGTVFIQHILRHLQMCFGKCLIYGVYFSFAYICILKTNVYEAQQTESYIAYCEWAFSCRELVRSLKVMLCKFIFGHVSYVQQWDSKVPIMIPCHVRM